MFAIKHYRLSRISVLLITVLCASLFAKMNNFHDGSCHKRKPKPDEQTTIEQLGKLIFFDKISSPNNMSCATCHGPNVGFTGPNPAINMLGSVYPGAIHQRFGNRKPPSAAYAAFSPIFHYDQQQGSFVGGNFWDGRATGDLLGNPAADQALGPFLNPVEQNNPSKLSVLCQIAQAPYANLWIDVFGTPLNYYTPQQINTNYNNVGLAIAAYEASTEVSPFTSKYDYFLKDEAELSPTELKGLQLFNGAGKCAACHTSTVGTYNKNPLFTDFTYDNLGIPKNLQNPFYEMDKVFIDGVPINPLGKNWIDYGLGDYLRNTSEWPGYVEGNLGKFKVPTLRNVDKRPGTHFSKAYTHNGVFKSLKEVVHFYNTRDVISWPEPEVSQNINTSEVGNLGLTDEEEDAIVVFLETLSDGYRP